MTGYPGVVMTLNAAVQCLLLAGVNRIYHVRSRWPCLLLACAVDGLYVGLCLISRFAAFAAMHWHLIMLAATGALAFGVSADAWRRIAIYILLNMAMEGISVGMNTDKHISLIVALAILIILCGACLLDKRVRGRYIPMEIYYGDKHIRLTALEDTGNMLTDPLTGQYVLVVNPNVASSITGLTQQQLRNPLEVLKKSGLPGLRLIPYKTVGQDGAFLLGLRMQVRIGKRCGKYLVAFAPEMFGQVGTYQALAGGIDL